MGRRSTFRDVWGLYSSTVESREERLLGGIAQTKDVKESGKRGGTLRSTIRMWRRGTVSQAQSPVGGVKVK